MPEPVQTLTLEFEEVPLITDVRRSGVVHGWLANCAAEIDFYEDGGWSIGRIWMEAFTGNSMATVPTEGVEIKRWAGVNQEAAHWQLVHSALVKHRQDKIAGAVRDAIDDGAFREVDDDRTDYFRPLIPAGAVQYPDVFSVEAA